MDYASLSLRLFLDLLSITALAVLFASRRPRRGLPSVFVSFNLGVFVVLTVITEKHVGPAVGFGLFAMLSIVRLRSEPFGNVELSYFFCALVLALANGLPLDDELVPVLGDVLVLATLYLVDHPALYRATLRQEVVLDEVIAGDAELRAELERRLGVEVIEHTVREIDYVREVLRVDVRVARPLGTPTPEPELVA